MTITENKELIFTDFEEKTQCVSTETIKEMWKAYKKSKEPVQTSCVNYERDNEHMWSIKPYIEVKDWKQQVIEDFKKNYIEIDKCKDSIVESVRQKLLDRSNVGIKKYGKTVDQEILKPSEWLEHAIQENLDMVVYQTKLKQELEKEENIKEFTKTIFKILKSDQNEMSVGNKIIKEYNKLIEI